MCGRVVQKTPLGEIRVLFETVNPIPNAAPTFNGAPTDTIPAVRLDRDGRRSLDLLRWGLVPWWAKDIKMGVRCINAMAETVASKPAFRDAFARGQRCIVPVDAFYEWKKIGSPTRSSAPMGCRSPSRGCGSAGRTRQAARRGRPSQSSQRRPTSFAAPSTIGCR